MVAVLIISVVGPSYASAASSGEESAKQKQKIIEAKAFNVLKTNLNYSKKETKQTIKRVETISKYFHRDKNGIIFDHKRAIKDGVDKKLVSTVKKDMDELEKFKKSKAKDGEVGTMASCPGVTGHYSSQSVALFDDCVTRDLSALLFKGATIYAIAGAILGAVTGGAGLATVIAGIVMGYTSWELSFMNRGRGVWVFYGERSEIISQ